MRKDKQGGSVGEIQTQLKKEIRKITRKWRKSMISRKGIRTWSMKALNPTKERKEENSTDWMWGRNKKWRNIWQREGMKERWSGRVWGDKSGQEGGCMFAVIIPNLKKQPLQVEILEYSPPSSCLSLLTLSFAQAEPNAQAAQHSVYHSLFPSWVCVMS